MGRFVITLSLFEYDGLSALILNVVSSFKDLRDILISISNHVNRQYTVTIITAVDKTKIVTQFDVAMISTKTLKFFHCVFLTMALSLVLLCLLQLPWKSAIAMDSCMYNNSGPIRILPDQAIGQIYLHDTIEIQFDVHLSTTTTECRELWQCNILGIGYDGRFPLIYIDYGYFRSELFTLVYEMTYAGNAPREIYKYPSEYSDGNTSIIDGQLHNLYSKFTLASTLIILDYDIIIANETGLENSLKYDTYFGTLMPIKAAYNLSGYDIGVWPGNITNLCINSYEGDYSHSSPPTKSPIPTSEPTDHPTHNPTRTQSPTADPTKQPSPNPTRSTSTPSLSPSNHPTLSPSSEPSVSPLPNPSLSPTIPTINPS